MLSESISNHFLCYQTFIPVHDIPSVHGRSAHLRAKCLMHEGTSCWYWPAADLDRFFPGNKHLVWNTTWPLLSPRRTGAGRTSKGTSQLPNFLLSKHRTSTCSNQMAVSNDKDTRTAFSCHPLTFVEWLGTLWLSSHSFIFVIALVVRLVLPLWSQLLPSSPFVRPLSLHGPPLLFFPSLWDLATTSHLRDLLPGFAGLQLPGLSGA